MLASADVQLISLKDLPVFANTIPSKLPATLAAGHPIIGALSGDAARIIENSGAGWTVPPGAGPELADAIRAAAALPREQLAARGAAGRDYYHSHLSEAVGAGALVALLERSAQRAGSDGRRRGRRRFRARPARG